MKLSNQPVSPSDVSESHGTSDDRLRKRPPHCRQNSRSNKPPNTDLTPPENRTERQGLTVPSRDLPSSSAPQGPQSSIFDVSPIEDALLRAAFTGKFTL